MQLFQYALPAHEEDTGRPVTILADAFAASQQDAAVVAVLAFRASARPANEKGQG